MLRNFLRIILNQIKEKLRKELFKEAAAQVTQRFLLKYDDNEQVQRILELGRFRQAIVPVPYDQPEMDRILAYAPHQDDVMIGAGGTLIRCHASGKWVKTIYVTDGAARTKPTNQADHAAVRREEAIRVWECVGAEPPEFWDLPCRNIPLTEENAKIMRKQIKESKAECIFVPFFMEPPLDHRKVSQLLAMAHQNDPLPKNLEIWSYQVSNIISPNVVVDITDITDNKEKINEFWESQNVEFNYAHFARGMNAYNSIFLPKKRMPYPQKRYAEVFFVTDARKYVELVNKYSGIN